MFSEENTLIMNEHELKVKSAAFIILHSILNKQKKPNGMIGDGGQLICSSNAKQDPI